MIKKLLLLTLAFILQKPLAQAQLWDSLRVVTGTNTFAAREGYQPLHFVANRFGTVADRKFDQSSYLRISNRLMFGFAKSDSLLSPGQEKPFSIDLGADIYNNRAQSLIFQEAFIIASYRGLSFKAGRYEEVTGEADQDLSTGSLGVSGNALPIPQIAVSISDYKNIPFTKGWLQFKGSFSHGWMGKNQFMKDAYLHQKTFYGRIGKNKLRMFGGVQHFAVWGGRRADFTELDRSWKGFYNVVLVKEADDFSVDFGRPRDSLINRPNKAGDHRGVIEGGLEWDADRVAIKMYHQTPFDMGQGITFKNIDKLLGISLSNKKPGQIMQKLLLEFIHTKQMTSYDPASHRESYYNNGIYATGWEYENHIIGTPLFTNRTRGSKYFSEIRPFDWDAAMSETPGNSNIINNRVVGGHIGMILRMSPSVRSKTLLTYTQNYGTFAPGPFSPYQRQSYTLQQFSYQPRAASVALTGSVGYDFGQLSNNSAVMLGLEWRIIGRNLTR